MNKTRKVNPVAHTEIKGNVRTLWKDEAVVVLVADHEHLHAALDGGVTPDRYAPVGRLGVERRYEVGGQSLVRTGRLKKRGPDADVIIYCHF